MANNSTKKTTANKTKKVSEEKKVTTPIETAKTVEAAEIVEAPPVFETKPVKETTPEKKKYNATDGIPCVSIAPGELGMIGLKSGINYTWNGRGDEVDVEYQDLVAAIRVNKKHIKEPYFIIQDMDFLSQYPEVEKIYAEMYSVKDLKDVLRLEPTAMKELLVSLPNGARESIKSIASTMITNGTLDSITRIKILDEVFDTNLMLMTELHK